MLYTNLTVNNKDYKLRLDAKACVELEKKLGTNPLNIFTKIGQTGEVPGMDVLITILHASLQAFNHNFGINETYKIYDEYVDEGHTMMDLIPVIMEVFKVSGFFKEEEPTDPNA